MKPTVLLLVLALLVAALASCVVRTQNGRAGRSRACPPAHHWDGFACVHNGNGHGKHKKHKGH